MPPAGRRKTFAPPRLERSREDRCSSVSQRTPIFARVGRADQRAGRGIDQDRLRSTECEAMGGLDLVTAPLERVEGRAQRAVLEQDLSAFGVPPAGEVD